MSKSAYRDAFITMLFGAALAGTGLASADDMPAPADQTAAAAVSAETDAERRDDWGKVMELGKIDVHASKEDQAQRIVAGLKVIKQALKASLSNDPADANKVVCRMNYDTGSHLNAHLMCATNHTMMIDLDALHTAMMTGTYGQPTGAETQELEHLAGSGKTGRYFSTEISAAELQKLLLQVQCDGCSDSGLVVGNN
ncbi:MAG TPA: hypothetical protein VGM47_01280 [Gammaproteobacteria bacterium]|jgi:hypothetical protein